ncbi:hypothetical protein BCR37DRAFT_376081 [Protomyces lactucae-debilis]|uniref:Uncharacterized protein n=1 Tax=Protomyces lactucae-debilis TaxID=2754530 RepID=A0A1Y2FS65_PROLT|nr:uncharacterized protein BCR37DRAFT_376081 [Protomyces lactucae-debilis]ORY86833.1 hypothetical protein BCR37DRAFT_376081 [Protomyces lactucae-debilis]
MQSQIREDLAGSTYSLAAPPGHAQQQQYNYQGGGQQAYQVVHHPSAQSGYDGSSSVTSSLPGDKKRPSENFRHFSSRFSNTSYNPSFRTHQQTESSVGTMNQGPGLEGFMMEDETKMRGDQKRGMFRGTAQMDWLDKLRQHPKFALYVFLGLNAAMLLVIFITGMIWLALGIVKNKKFLSGIPPPSNAPINNP